MTDTAPSVERQSLAEVQRCFTARIRAPATQPLPDGVDCRRMQVYEELFYNNLEALLAGNFPVIRSLMAGIAWHRLVRDFFATHRCRTPLFTEIGEEFVAYLAARQGKGGVGSHPFLCELAHYEWVELALTLSDADEGLPPLDRNGDPWSGMPVRSPLAWLLSYRFPVHRIGPDFLPERPGETPTRLLVYRDRQDRVRFVEINAVTHRLLDLLEIHPDWTGERVVRRVASELERSDAPEIVAAGRSLLGDLRKRNVILGTRLADARAAGNDASG